MNIHVDRTPPFHTAYIHICCQGQTSSLTVRPDATRWVDEVADSTHQTNTGVPPVEIHFSEPAQWPVQIFIPIPYHPRLEQPPTPYCAGDESKENKSIWPPPLDGTVVVLHTPNIMIMTFCFYARILEDLFQLDSRSSYTRVAYGRPLTTKTSNVTYLTLTLHQRLYLHKSPQTPRPSEEWTLHTLTRRSHWLC